MLSNGLWEGALYRICCLRNFFIALLAQPNTNIIYRQSYRPGVSGGRKNGLYITLIYFLFINFPKNNKNKKQKKARTIL